MDLIIQKNLEKMTVYKEGSMSYQLMNESIGGNAGMWNGIPCGATNFIYDNKTGKIFVFTNNAHKLIPVLNKYPKIAEKIKGSLKEGTYRIVDSIKKRQKRIIELILHPDTEDLARQTLEETVRIYNKNYGFAVEAA